MYAESEMSFARAVRLCASALTWRLPPRPLRIERVGSSAGARSHRLADPRRSSAAPAAHALVDRRRSREESTNARRRRATPRPKGARVGCRARCSRRRPSRAAGTRRATRPRRESNTTRVSCTSGRGRERARVCVLLLLLRTDLECVQLLEGGAEDLVAGLLQLVRAAACKGQRGDDRQTGE